MKNTMTIGIDLAKNTFFLVALTPSGQQAWRKKLSRRRVLPYLGKLENCRVALEACAGAHYWARHIKALGHEVQLLPPQRIKTYLRGQKNDYNDAEAIAEACQHGRIRAVKAKSISEQDEQSFLRLRRQLVDEQTRLVNQLRGLLSEYGIIIPQGIAAFRRQIPEILEEAENELSPWMRELIERQYQRFLALTDELSWYQDQLEAQAKADDTCQRLQTLPGFGPTISYAFKSWVGDGQQFRRGRDAAAALGVVPRQHSTGGRQVLLGITKKGDKELRAMIVQGAWAVLARAPNKEDPLSRWVTNLAARRGKHKALIALANKLIRMAWVIVARNDVYRLAA